MSRPAKLSIDVSALKHNLYRVREIAPNSKIIAMVKANAYGHGLSRVVNALNTADAFGVACLEEAEIIRNVGMLQPIICFAGFYSSEELDGLIKLNCEAVVHHDWQIDALEQARLSAPIKVWLKINTGMNRLGFLPEKIAKVYGRLQNCNNVAASPNLLTHFADADIPEKDTTIKQIEIFKQIARDLPGEKSLANTAGILLHKKCACRLGAARWDVIWCINNYW